MDVNKALYEMEETYKKDARRALSKLLDSGLVTKFPETWDGKYKFVNEESIKVLRKVYSHLPEGIRDRWVILPIGVQNVIGLHPHPKAVEVGYDLTSGSQLFSLEGDNYALCARNFFE